MKSGAFVKHGNQRSLKPIIIGVNIFLLLCIAAVLLFSFRGREKPAELAVGEFAVVNDALNIPLFQPAPFSGLTSAEILKLRESVVNRHPNLLKSEYRPYSAVFENMTSRLPWFSIAGYYFLGPSEQSFEGPSNESKLILNPFLLAAAEFWDLTIWSDKGIKWNKAAISGEMLQKPDFPFYCKPADLRWYPAEKRGEVTYHLTEFIRQLNPYILSPVSDEQRNFGIIAYNARDFGYRFIAVDPQKSVNTDAPKARDIATKITDEMKSRNRFCGIPAGCNNMGRPMPQLDTINISSLPAKLSVKLWRNKPSDTGQPADFVFDINVQ